MLQKPLIPSSWSLNCFVTFYSFSKELLKLIKGYLNNRWQRTNISTERILGVSQKSVLGPLLFNIYINNLFLLAENSHVFNYPDDTTVWASNSNFQNLILRKEHFFSIHIKIQQQVY